MVEFLTPLAKIYGSESGLRGAEIGTQVLGGYGYLTEYGLDQTYRDARITMIYEGSNGIHTRTLATRCVKIGSADAFSIMLADLGTQKDVLGLWEKALGMVKSKNAVKLAHYFAQVAMHTLVIAVANQYEKHADQALDPIRVKRVVTHAKINARAEISKAIIQMECVEN